ncbi:MAG TPA: dicarboxylate/amino acid:cation symporter [Pseudomonadales bacterium]|jgi:Na+/H+-dicarboxylate symporter|nr:dicarboxylate/amino acid:cation symporter [Pseudomonadales bacterium]HRG50076.1 dicarboxylate/amino acid:cation symporter [Pseudomonadales bacterium]
MSLNTRILLGSVAGILLGWLFSAPEPNALSHYGLLTLGVISTVFVGLLKMVMVPLVFTSIVVGVAQLQAHHSMRRVWLTALLFFTLTATLAVMLGISAMHWFAPASDLKLDMFQDAMAAYKNSTSLSPSEFISHFASSLFVNPVRAMAEGNLMGVLLFALLMGIALVAGGERYANIKNLLTELFDLMMRLLDWIVQLAPFGICALLAKLVATQNAEVFASLGKFIVVITGTTLFHGLVVLPLLLWLLTRYSPLTFLRKARPALLTAFATSSSSATLPITLNCLERDMGVRKDIANFIAPLGAQMNMDGTALYEAGAALFVAQLCGIELNLLQQVIVCLTAMLVSVGAPGIPSAGMVTMVMVLQSVGLPVEAIAILLPIDRILDTTRTAINVEGDLVGSLVVQHFASNEIIAQ